MADAKTEKQKVKEITDRLEEGLKELFESEKYKDYLSTMSKFHNYSFNNTLLIAMQKPEATLVAGYKAWQTNFNRHVNKGEKGIRILAPAPYTIKEEREKLDPVTGEPMLDEYGMPQREEVDVKIPAFRAVSVFDVSQTDGEPIPELEAKELLATVDGYEDFIKAVTYVAPVPVGFEDIPGSSRGYFSPTEKRIAVQEGMSESQTLKTMVHETAHSMLHDKEVNAGVLSAPAKDRNTKEVEAESIAFTVCQHFGIDTSDYSFGYIAGWSSGKDMKELKSSLDTIRKTASELITGIEGQLMELRRDREIMQAQEKESLLLVQNHDLSEYSLISVRGMDKQELLDALSAMDEGDRQNIQAYLDSRGAWTTEIANEGTREFGEYHIDVRYFSDTGEIIDVKKEMEMDMEDTQENEKAMPEVKQEESMKEVVDGGNPMPEDTDTYRIYQLKDAPELHYYRFEGTAALLKQGLLSDTFKEITPDNYDLVYEGQLSDIAGQSRSGKLGAIFEKFNIDHPEDFKGHSLSVSDVVVLHEDGKNSAHYVDSYGFTELPDFMRALENVKEQAQDTSGHDVQKPEKAEKEEYPAVYRQSRDYAVEHGEIDGYRESRRLNLKCKEAVEASIRENFDGMHLNPDAVKPVLEEYGEKRVTYVLSATIQMKSWDGRFSNSNKEWADKTSIPENIVMGDNINTELIVSSHPAVLDGFVDLFRKEIRERELDVGKGLDTSGHNVQKSEPEVPGPEDGDEIIDLGDEREQVLAEMKGSLTDGNETELAFQIADRYISIQEVDGGYDYSIMGIDYKEIDGGVYDNPDISIREALKDVVEDLRHGTNNPAVKGGVAEDSELIPIDYDGLMENVEEANRVIPEKPQSSVVADFKAKTNELFHEISDMNPSEIEETIKCHVQAKLDEYGIDAQIVDVAVVGTRCRGLEREGSDLDVVVELSTDEREDMLFDTFNEDGLSIGGIKVDINPITLQRTGTLETYLPQVEVYLDGVREAREQEAERAELLHEETVRMDIPQITFTVAECGEFHDMGEFYGNIPTVEEAVAIWEQIPPERMNGIPAIGINVHVPGNEPYQDTGIDIFSGKRIDLELLDHIPEIKGNPQAMEAVAEIIAKFPDAEIDGRMSEKLEAKVWEKRMPELTPAEQLAVEFDRFMYDYDRSQYIDMVQGMTENVAEGAMSIEKGDMAHMTTWLADVIAEGTDPEEIKRAAELLEKLTEYKPLAKVEEMEEQNYNMIDNVLNNGAGEKAQKEENKKENDLPATKISLKARLAKKKEQISGKGQDTQDKTKEKHRAI